MISTCLPNFTQTELLTAKLRRHIDFQNLKNVAMEL